MRSGWFVVGVVGSAATAVTCYRPNAETECTLACDSACPDGLVCGSDSPCHAAGAKNCTDRSGAVRRQRRQRRVHAGRSGRISGPANACGGGGGGGGFGYIFVKGPTVGGTFIPPASQ